MLKTKFQELYSMICYRESYVLEIMDIVKVSQIQVEIDRQDNLLYKLNAEVSVRKLNIP